MEDDSLSQEGTPCGCRGKHSRACMNLQSAWDSVRREREASGKPVRTVADAAREGQENAQRRAKMLAEAIIEDLSGRSGGDHFWESCDPEVQREVIATWTAILEPHVSGDE